MMQNRTSAMYAGTPQRLVKRGAAPAGCYACKRAFTVRPPPKILVEYGVTPDGRPLEHTYTPLRGETSASVAPESASFRLLSDIRVRNDGELVFADISDPHKCRLPKDEELSQLWDMRQDKTRDFVQPIDVSCRFAGVQPLSFSGGCGRRGDGGGRRDPGRALLPTRLSTSSRGRSFHLASWRDPP